MPVKTVGKNVVEVATGKVVAHSKSKEKAKSAARIRNMAHAMKEGKLHMSKAKMDKYFGEH